jgi:hydroquinone glucosyltransferase
MEHKPHMHHSHNWVSIKIHERSPRSSPHKHRAIDHVFLPPVNLNDLPAGEQPGIQVFLTMTRSLPSIRDVLKSLVETSRLAAVILDHTAIDAHALDVAKELNLSPYIFFTSSALALSLILHLPKLDETISCEYRDPQEPLRLPGCVPRDGGDLMDHVQDRKSELYKLSLRHTKRLRLAEGIMVNTFMDLQGRAIKLWKRKELETLQFIQLDPSFKLLQLLHRKG